jgi:hypothetical protein
MALRPPTETTLRLAEGSERLLHWLARSPLQRGNDLVVVLAPWERRTSVYAHLAELEQQHLIESFHAGIAGRTRLYHLSPLGTYVRDWLAWSADPESVEKHARVLQWEQRGIGPCVQAERARLVRLLPRLPVLLLVQAQMNSLITHAGPALARAGHQPDMLGWSWLREYALTFRTSHDEAVRLQVEGALALCLRFAPEDAAVTEAWSTLFVLHCPIDDVRLMRARFERLLRWRESAERTAVYSQMPPILILATTDRQAEWWQQAARQVASRLRVDLPLGAITCLPREAEPVPNLWHATFRRLGTGELCHIQDLLRSWSAPAVPALLALRGEARATSAPGTKHELPLVLPPRLPHRCYALAGALTHARQQVPDRTSPRDQVEEYRQASVLLTPRHWEILRLCFAHPLLSHDDLTHLLGIRPATTNALLALLEHVGYLVCVDTLTGNRWQVGEAGLRALARLAGCHVHRLVRLPKDEAGAPLIQRGVPGLLHQIRHTAGVYTFFALLTSAFASTPDAWVRWWETGAISERHFSFQDKLYRFRPDALASVQCGARTMRFWLEWDRGTMTLKDLRVKFTTYRMYLTSREWASSSPMLPALLCVTPDVGQEKRLINVARQYLISVPRGFCLYTTTAHLLLTQGILGSIWRPVAVSPQPFVQMEEGEVSPRVSLFLEREEKRGSF